MFSVSTAIAANLSELQSESAPWLYLSSLPQHNPLSQRYTSLSLDPTRLQLESRRFTGQYLHTSKHLVESTRGLRAVLMSSAKLCCLSEKRGKLVGRTLEKSAGSWIPIIRHEINAGSHYSPGIYWLLGYLAAVNRLMDRQWLIPTPSDQVLRYIRSTVREHREILFLPYKCSGRLIKCGAEYLHWQSLEPDQHQDLIAENFRETWKSVSHFTSIWSALGIDRSRWVPTKFFLQGASGNFTQEMLGTCDDRSLLELLLGMLESAGQLQNKPKSNGSSELRYVIRPSSDLLLQLTLFIARRLGIRISFTCHSRFHSFAPNRVQLRLSNIDLHSVFSRLGLVSCSPVLRQTLKRFMHRYSATDIQRYDHANVVPFPRWIASRVLSDLRPAGNVSVKASILALEEVVARGFVTRARLDTLIGTVQSLRLTETERKRVKRWLKAAKCPFIDWQIVKSVKPQEETEACFCITYPRRSTIVLNNGMVLWVQQ